MVVYCQELTRLNLTNCTRPYRFQRCCLACNRPASFKTAKNEGSHTVGIPRGVEGILVHEYKAKGTLQPGKKPHCCFGNREIRIGTEQRGNDRRISGRNGAAMLCQPECLNLTPKLCRVD
ncbi:hypothetical protein Vau01_011610 [Virgisporangium aurantiacum]|uniref:Uncharacterized protein n=1 Tax=Virgisporangium aurantiacum TaxID=175570 RepID=A0A8J3Z1W0_9ACTN|nr:hypothetical protein Vau01_011610 [Virgisporangium aurantiacum]